jgi:phage tail-like protein
MLGYNPPVGFHFIVRFNGLEGAQLDTMFQSVSGLSASIETEEVAFGGENRFKHVLPVRTKYPNLVLKRGMLLESKLIEWCTNAIENFEFKPLDLTITLLSEQHLPLMTWNVVHAYPIRWEIEEFNSMESKLIAETIELSYHYFTTLSVIDKLKSL